MKIDFERLKQINWYRQEAKPCNYFMLNPSLAVLEQMRGGMDLVLLIKKHKWQIFINPNFYRRKAEKVIKKFRKDRNYVKYIYTKWHNWNKELLDLIDQVCSLGSPFPRKRESRLPPHSPLIRGEIVGVDPRVKPEDEKQVNLRTISNKSLLNLNFRLGRLSYDYWLNPIFIDIFDPCGEDLIRDELDQQGLNISPKDRDTLLLPDRLLVSQTYRLDLLKVLEASQAMSERLVENLIKKYYFIHCSYAQATQFTTERAKKDLSHEKKQKNWGRELINLNNFPLEVRRAKQKIYKKYKFSKWHQDFFELFAFLTFWRDERKMVLQKTVFALNILGKEIARRSKLHWAKVDLVPPDTIKTIPVSAKLIQKFEKLTRNNYLHIFNPHTNKHIAFDKKTCEKLLEIFQPKSTNISEVRGRPANNGFAKGIARIVLGEHDFKKFKKDDILVTAMTRPEFMPILRHAKAIVTDEGGITCHAAIVSRELGIPCVIGTQRATQIFKSGEKIVVDATNGVVKKSQDL